MLLLTKENLKKKKKSFKYIENIENTQFNSTLK